MMTTLTPAARRLGEQPAFPVQWEYAQNETGMTYRQWLIGQAFAATRTATFEGNVAQKVISLADATLNALAEEQS